MGEATAMQGILPLLAGVGEQIWADCGWLGDSAALRDALGLYRRICGGGLGDKVLQQDAKGSVVEPKEGIAKMPDRDAAVGYALIPAQQPGAGIRGQDFMSTSGGSGRVINPATKYPQQTWELLQFMNQDGPRADDELSARDQRPDRAAASGRTFR